jgi:hypothetical protein
VARCTGTMLTEHPDAVGLPARKKRASEDGLHAGSGELPPADQAALGQHNGAPIKLVPSSAPPQQPIEEASPKQAMPMSEPQQAAQVGEPQVTLRLAKPEEAEVIAKQVR